MNNIRSILAYQMKIFSNDNTDILSANLLSILIESIHIFHEVEKSIKRYE